MRHDFVGDGLAAVAKGPLADLRYGAGQALLLGECEVTDQRPGVDATFKEDVAFEVVAQAGGYTLVEQHGRYLFVQVVGAVQS